MAQFRPMLAATVESLDKLTYPLLGSDKLDGIRAIVLGGRVVSRNLKPIPNRHVQAVLGHARYDGLDGELIVGDPCSELAFNTTTRGVMSVEGEPEFQFHVFDDCTDPALEFRHRYKLAAAKIKALGGPLQLVHQHELDSAADVEKLEQWRLGLGYEGIMLRSALSPYKHGRGTLRAQDLMKLKRFEDGEAEVVGFEELMRNANEATTSALGLTERSTSKEGKYGGGTLGALVVRAINGPFAGVQFNIGSGFNQAQRDLIWSTQAYWLGRVVKYKFFLNGSKDAPRFPIFQGERHPGDM